MNASAPVGVFDSGLGGVSVLRELVRTLPHEDFVYLADSAWCPYGGRPAAEVAARAGRVTEILLERGSKLVVVACNTATVAAIAQLRARWPIEFVGVEPAVKPAAAASRSRVVGVLSTRVTATGARMHALIERYAHGVKVLTQACPGLVERVEAGDLDGATTRALVENYVRPLLAAGADTLVLGCTHYAFLRPLIAEVAGPAVAIVEPGRAVARRVADRLAALGLAASAGDTGTVEWLTTGSPQALERVGRRLWGSVLHARAVHDAPVVQRS